MMNINVFKLKVCTNVIIYKYNVETLNKSLIYLLVIKLFKIV